MDELPSELVLHMFCIMDKGSRLAFRSVCKWYHSITKIEEGALFTTKNFMTGWGKITEMCIEKNNRYECRHLDRVDDLEFILRSDCEIVIHKPGPRFMVQYCMCGRCDYCRTPRRPKCYTMLAFYQHY
uniref:F-box domain-containing protein n=1 Tax=Clandestinovirus TaxID=2831644 RepID=A0A8F8PQT1_9VIRU|nr:F-box domain-containing protein [Clandestinovirus]